MTASTNGYVQFPDGADARAAALWYADTVGLFPIPAHHRTKKPVPEGWTSLHLRTAAEIEVHFPAGAPLNVGILLQPTLVDVDVDADEARRVVSTGTFLPATSWVSGRASAPRSHFWYRAAGARFTKFLDPTIADKTDDRACLVEFRTGKHHTLAPPSVHPSGEAIVWHSLPGVPPEEDPSQLTVRVALLAAAALLVRYYPAEGGRHDFALHLSGALAREGWPQGQIEWFLQAIASAAGDPEVSDRARAAGDSVKKVAEGDPTTGWPRLTECLGNHGEAIVRAVRKWLRPRKAKAGDGEGKKASASTRLVKMVEDAQVELFHSPDLSAFATVPGEGDSRICWPVKSTAFRRWLSRRFYDEEGVAASSQAIANALTVLEGKAAFDGPECPVWLRVGETQGKLYLDLADPEGRAVEVDSSGWRVVTTVPVWFPRRKATLPLPLPERGGPLDQLRHLIAVRQEDWPLLLGWLFGGYRPQGPFPVLTLSGEQGTAKTTKGKMLQRLLDPTIGDLRAEPKEPRDLMIAANAAWLVAYDNLSHLPQWLSDCLCRLATGGAGSVSASCIPMTRRSSSPPSGPGY
jgi:hypothetical protein